MAVIGNFVDRVGTALQLPEWGISEKLAGGNNTVYTGLSPQSQQAGYSYNPGNYYGPAYGPTYNPPQYQSTGGNTGGQVLGAQAPTGDQGQSGPSAYEQWANNIRGTINSGYDSLGNALGQMENDYGKWQAEQEANLGNVYGSLQSGIQQGYEQGQQKLGNARTAVSDRVKASSADVAQNLRNMLKTTGMRLGAMGAGDSSASRVFAPYAFSKVAAKEQGNVTRQGNQQYGELDQKGIDLESMFTQQKTELDKWKFDALTSIKDKFMPLIDRVRMMRANAPVERAQALSNLETQLLDRAQAEARGIQDQYRTFALNMAQSIATGQGKLPDWQNALSAASQFMPRDIAYNRLPGAQIGGMGQGQSAMINPYFTPPKREDENTYL